MSETNKEVAEIDGWAGNGVPDLPTIGGDSIQGGGGGGEDVQQSSESYIYRDFAHANTGQLDAGAGISHHSDNMPPSSLQSQKLPSKLANLLSDPDLAAVITWMPHGRSWKILNRDLFSQFALPRYFGHKNHSSFVRIVNAWGFRRISNGVDRDSYYHELFLRGKPQLHERMKRVPACHKKTPVDKNDKHPDFYEMSNVSPLPEVTWNKPTTQGGVAQLPGVAGLTTANLVGGGMLHANPNLNNPMSLLEGPGASSSAAAIGGVTSGAQPPVDLTAYTKRLEQENENLLLKIKLLEYEAQARQQKAEAATKDDDAKDGDNSNTGQV